MHIDLNADLGEGFGRWDLGDDDALLAVVTSANVACGFHAGDAVDHAPGLRPGGRARRRDRRPGRLPRPAPASGGAFIDVRPDELTHDVIYQIGALEAFARVAGPRVRYVKPHGALYNAIVHHEEQAAAPWSRRSPSTTPTLPVLGLPGSGWLRAGRGGRSDRRPRGLRRPRLHPRGHPGARAATPGAVLHDPDEIARRCLSRSPPASRSPTSTAAR